jgi:hypothetical protein
MIFLIFFTTSKKYFSPKIKGKYFSGNQAKFFFDWKCFPLTNFSNSKQTQESLERKQLFVNQMGPKMNCEKRSERIKWKNNWIGGWLKWCEPHDHVVMQPTIKIEIWSRKVEIGLIGVWHNRNLPQGTNTIGWSRMTSWSQLIFVCQIQFVQELKNVRITLTR